MKQYFVSYYWAGKKGSGHGCITLDIKPGIVLSSSIPVMMDEIKRLNPGCGQVVILNWIPFDSEIEKSADGLEDITFTHSRDAAGAVHLTVHKKRTMLFSLPMDVVRADHIANIFGKDLIHA